MNRSVSITVHVRQESEISRKQFGVQIRFNGARDGGKTDPQIRLIAKIPARRVSNSGDIKSTSLL
jgi:hypothetical protein